MREAVFKLIQSSRGHYWVLPFSTRTIYRTFDTEADCARSLAEFIFAIKCDRVKVEQQDVREDAFSNETKDYIGGIVRLRSYLPKRERKILSLVDERCVRKPTVRRVKQAPKPKSKVKPMKKPAPKPVKKKATKTKK